MNSMFIKMSKPGKDDEQRVMSPWLNNGLHFPGRKLFNVSRITMIKCYSFRGKTSKSWTKDGKTVILSVCLKNSGLDGKWYLHRV